jgi:antitoxin ParD1/3/4
MTITLIPEHEAWLRDHVARGDFESADDAIRRLIDACIAEEGDDLLWAKPLVDEALQAVSRGEIITLDEHRARNATRLARLKG